jgi:hypothetical protein
MNQILGRLEWRLLMNKYSKDLFYDIIENHGITSKQGKRFLTSWNAIKQNLNCPFFGNRWDDLESRRPLTRGFYDQGCKGYSQ